MNKWYNKKLYGKNWKEISRKERTENPICAICGLPVKLSNSNSDHIVELSRGGHNNKFNRRVVHASCHKRKTALNKPKKFPRGRGKPLLK